MNNNHHNQRGAMLITSTAFLFFLILIAILTMNIGRMVIVRNELQNGADAAALAGALCLNKQTGAAYTGYCTIPVPTDPINWDGAHDKSVAAAGANAIDGAPLSVASGQVQFGYWNLLTNSPSGGTLSKSFSPITINDKPAVQVTANRNAPLLRLNVPTFILTTFSSSTSAVAVISNPGSVGSGSLIPYAIAKCMYDKFWDSAANTPKIYHTGDSADAALLASFTTAIPQVNNQPWRVRIGDSYHYGTCVDSGQWTTFQDSSASSQSAVEGLIDNGNPQPIALGDNMWISTGVAAANYTDLGNTFTNKDVTVPVLTVITPTGQYSPIVAFGAFHIDAVNKMNKYVEGHFIPAVITTGGSGVGPAYGAYTPPRLAQ